MRALQTGAACAASEVFVGRSLNVTFLNRGKRIILRRMDVQSLLSEFLRPVAWGTGAVLAVIAIVGLRMPRRSKVEARPARPR